MSDHMHELTRRTLLATSAAVGVAALAETNMANAISGGGSVAIRPFRASFPDSDLADLKRRIAATKWPDRELVNDATQGVQQATMQKLHQYWLHNHDWRKVEARINSFPNFITELDGLDIHFMHVRSKHENAMPLIVTHGWPGSVIEQLKIIEPLTNPTAFGGRAEDAFHVVVPSLPGYGFSAKPTQLGWEPNRIARAWTVLMKRLGYNKFVAQGGDWGNSITEIMALQQPPELLGISTNMAATVPPEIVKALATGAPKPSNLNPQESRAWDQLTFFYKFGLGYANEMALRPQTLYGLADSPIGLAGWILDHDARSYDLITRVFDGKHEGLTRDDILDNITLYWLSNTAVSSARLYWEFGRVAKSGFFDARGVTVPTCVTVFEDEIYAAPETWAKRAYSKLIQYTRHEKGCHFAAWEQPELLVKDLREGFRSLRAA